MKQEDTYTNDAKKVFKKLGTCSHTFFHIVNREFNRRKEAEGRASDPLAGGLMQKGYQCGMIWGAALAIGAESYHRYNNPSQRIGLAISATQLVVDSFKKRTNTINCRDITKCNMDSFLGMTKYMIMTRIKGIDNSVCFKLAENWAPEALAAVKESLSRYEPNLSFEPKSCAVEVVRKMGGSEEEMIMVAGFAGGLGLSGSACGALSAAVWKNSLELARIKPGQSMWGNEMAKKTLEEFLKTTDSELTCQKICGKNFNTIESHTDFINSGGCNDLMDKLSSITPV